MAIFRQAIAEGTVDDLVPGDPGDFPIALAAAAGCGN
jgi:hypothetical protein